MHDLLARFWHFVGNIDECRMREKEKNFALSEEKRKLFEQFDKNQKNNIYKEKSNKGIVFCYEFLYN